MRGQISWNDETGFWTVTDEYGDIWDVVDLDGAHAALVREDSQRFYGAYWTADDSNPDMGTVSPVQDKAEFRGADSTYYQFFAMKGWIEVDCDH